MKHKQIQKVLLIGACGALLLLAVLAAGLLLPKSGVSGNNNIARHVTIGGVDVSKMTEEEAAAAVSAVYSDVCEHQDMVLVFPNRKHILSPEDTGARWMIPEAVEQAKNSPASGEIPLEFQVNMAYIRGRVVEILENLGGVYQPSGYQFLGDIPQNRDEEVQTLILNRGNPGLDVDVDGICQGILESYKSGTFRYSVGEIGTIREPEEIDITAAWESVYRAPKEPELNLETLEVTSGQKGYGFLLTDAQELLEQLRFGETGTLTCQWIDPQMSDEDVWFRDVLGSCMTPHTDNENRNENLRLACAALDGKILQPGEVLSYNDTLGKRTADRGYKPAPAYSGTELVDEVGGGICQVSSTLYLSCLLAEMQIVYRQNHGFPVDYIPIGLDATVNWGTTDLKIKNSYEHPIKISAQVTDTHVIVRILGLETRDFYVRIEHRVEGPRYASAYLCHYDPVTNKEISRTLDHASLYLDVVWQNPDYADNTRIVTYR